MPAVVAVLAVIEGADLPEDVLALLDRPLALSGTYGDSEAGDPIQYDELRIEHDQGVVEIVVYNRAVLLFFTDSEPVRRIRVALSDVHGSRRGSSRARFSAARRHPRLLRCPVAGLTASVRLARNSRGETRSST